MDYFVAAIPIAMFIAIGAWSLFRHVDQPPPPSALRACFVHDSDPSLHFDGMHLDIVGPDPQRVAYSFHLQHYGTLGIDTFPGLRVTRDPSGNLHFAAGESPFIDPMTPEHQVGPKLYPVFKIEDAEYLGVEVINGDQVTYKRAPPEGCTR